jgi:hypothetical protein
MKLSFALAALASAAVEWDGQSPNGGCGSQISGDSLVNSTCTVTGNNIKTMYAGNGAFIVSSNQLTGFDGVSGNVDLVVIFEQDCDGGTCDNSTCWEAEVNCVNNGAATEGMMFMETVNAANSGNLNLQIAGVPANTAIAVTLNDANGNGVGLKNITAPGGVVDSDESADGTFTVTSGENFGDLFQISVVTDAVVDLFQSTVA